MKRIKAPVQGHYVRNDSDIPLLQVEELEQTFEDAGNAGGDVPLRRRSRILRIRAKLLQRGSCKPGLEPNGAVLQTAPLTLRHAWSDQSTFSINARARCISQES
jgi:hypothetical protein